MLSNRSFDACRSTPTRLLTDPHREHILRLLTALFLPTLLAACATPLPEMSNDFLCQHYGNNLNGGVMRRDPTSRVPSIRAEVGSRKLLTEAESRAVEQGDLVIGMSRCGMYSVMGSPIAENSTTSAAGQFIQHVFFVPWRSAKRIYVYTKNGKVTSWQD